MNKQEKSKIEETILHVEGMHCSSCEIILEKSLLKMDGVKAVDASATKGTLLIEHTGKKPSVQALNKTFKKEGYKFSEDPKNPKKSNKSVEITNDGKLTINKSKLNNFLVVFVFSILLIIGFLSLEKAGIASLLNVNEKSGLSMFFLFGLLAGFSSCAALVGGIVLSMSKQWLSRYSSRDTLATKIQPHLLFNFGRLFSYLIFGAILGAVGSFFQLSLTFTSVLVLAVSVMMIFLGLQMLGVSYFQRFQITLPKFITRYIADESNFNGKYMPFSMGAMTFFLPCGFTITAQGLALTSGSMLTGAMIMFLFALGTVPSLLAIGLSSVTFSKNPRIEARFMKIAGTMVLFFAMFNINSQLVVLGYNSIEDLAFNSGNKANASLSESLPPIVNGKQILKMDALAYAYSPNNLVVRVGVPVRWEITDKGVSGCTNAIISKSLFEGDVPIVRGQTTVKEFTPKTPGKYKFSCWMGMVSGTIEVVDINEKGAIIPSKNTFVESEQATPSCGCGGGGGTSSCGGGASAGASSCGRGATTGTVSSCGGGSGCGGSCGR